jgi:hypothetical protein
MMEGFIFIQPTPSYVQLLFRAHKPGWWFPVVLVESMDWRSRYYVGTRN